MYGNSRTNDRNFGRLAMHLKGQTLSKVHIFMANKQRKRPSEFNLGVIMAVRKHRLGCCEEERKSPALVPSYSLFQRMSDAWECNTGGRQNLYPALCGILARHEFLF